MLIKLMRPLNVVLGAFSVLIIHSFLLFSYNTAFTILVVSCGKKADPEYKESKLILNKFIIC